MFNKKINGNWLWIIVAQFFVVVLLATLFNKASSIYPASAPITDGHIRRTLYLDRAFSEEEQATIARAANRWNIATNHIVEFEVESLPNAQAIFNNLSESVIIVIESRDHPDIVLRDFIADEGDYVTAFFNKNAPIPMLAVVH